MAQVPLVDLRPQHAALRDELAAAFHQVLDSGVLILGEQARRLEEELAAFCGAAHAVGVASGTDALTLSLKALGLGPGDEVIVPAFTFMATASSVAFAGATPVFADVEDATFCIDPESAASQVGPKTKAILPVHLFGRPADMSALQALADQHGLVVIEDAAQALGAECRGRRAGSLGRAGCLSFYPTKNLPACGDAGMVVTDDAELADRVRLLRACGDASVLGGPRYHYDRLGHNSRLDELQAALLRVKLHHLQDWNQRRREHAARYRALLADLDLVLPEEPTDDRHVWTVFTLRSTRRDALRAALTEAGVGTSVYYPEPLHLQPAFGALGYRAGDCPTAERLCGEVLSLPMYPELTEEQIQAVCQAVRTALQRK
jgi:dTDP-4-amino-4,6-dideoxygalactose transaminase